jgi:hypothetical protein
LPPVELDAGSKVKLAETIKTTHSMATMSTMLDLEPKNEAKTAKKGKKAKEVNDSPAKESKEGKEEKSARVKKEPCGDPDYEKILPVTVDLGQPIKTGDAVGNTWKQNKIIAGKQSGA